MIKVKPKRDQMHIHIKADRSVSENTVNFAEKCYVRSIGKPAEALFIMIVTGWGKSGSVLLLCDLSTGICVE